MKEIFVTSDTHFGHANILTFKDKNGDLIRGRLWQDIKDHDEALVENWNKVVKPGDKVYHLGDVFFGGKEAFKELWPRLNGSKRLVVGNHDDIPFLSAGGFFKKVYLWRYLKEMGLVLSHMPLHPSVVGEKRFKHEEMLNVHGHIHHNPSPEGPYRCVSVEQTEYTPVNIEELRLR